MTSTASGTEHETGTAGGHDTAETLDRTLDRWRARIDELKVQVDLATLDVRQDVAKRIEVTENVFLAIRSRLSDAADDTGKTASTLRQSVEQLLLDLRHAYDDSAAVVKRSHQA